MVTSPIFFARADAPMMCRHRHTIFTTNARHQVRGDPIHFLACSKCEPTTFAMGIQSTANDLISWYALTQELYTRLRDTDPMTPVISLLAIAGYHPLTEL